MLARFIAVVLAATSAIGVWLTWRVFVATRTGQAIEEAALGGATYGQTRLWRLAEPVLDVVSQSFLVAGVLVAVVIALLRRRWSLAVQAVVLVGGANLTTQILKRGVLDRPALGGDVGPPSLPSGHTTVAASFAAALLLVAPRWARPWIAVVGAVYTGATGVSTLIGQWHRPSDAVAAVLVVVAWTALVGALGPVGAGDRVRAGDVLDADARVRTAPADETGPVGSKGLAGPETSAGTAGHVGTVRRTGSPGTAPAAVVLVLGALLTGLPAGWAYVEAYRAATTGSEMAEVATYVGGAFAVAAVSAAAFTVLLFVCQSTARAGDV